MEKKKILITGVAGFLGSHLAQSLIERGHEVCGIDNLSGGDIKNIPLGMPYFLGDCNDLELMNHVLKDIDVVYHAACMPHEGVSMFSPKFITDSVFGATMSVVSAAIQQNVKRFVYLSSMARYGTQDRVPFTEDMTPKPQDPYGIAKYAAEESLRVLAETHGMEYVIAVPHSIIGPRQKYDDPFRNVASIFINLMLQGRSPAIYGDGMQTRSFSFVLDVVNPLMIMGLTEGLSGEVINIGPDGNDITIKELYDLVARLTGYTGEPMWLPGRPQEVKNASCSADKARKLLKFEPGIGTAEGILDMIKDIELKGTKPFQYHIPLEIHKPSMPKTWSEKLY